MNTALFVLASLAAAEPLTTGDHTRTVTVGPVERTYLAHIPEKYDPAKPTPIVLCFHGAIANGRIQVRFSDMNPKADAAGFIAVYPNGTGPHSAVLTWNSGGIPSKLPEAERDDVGFTRTLLD